MSSTPSGDWPSQITATIERVVGTVRDQATSRALTALRAVVFGLLAAILAVVALILLATGLVRFIDSYLPGGVWAAHLVIGSLFSVIGLWLFSRRHQSAEDLP